MHVFDVRALREKTSGLMDQRCIGLPSGDVDWDRDAPAQSCALLKFSLNVSILVPALASYRPGNASGAGDNGPSDMRPYSVPSSSLS